MTSIPLPKIQLGLFLAGFALPLSAATVWTGSGLTDSIRLNGNWSDGLPEDSGNPGTIPDGANEVDIGATALVGNFIFQTGSDLSNGDTTLGAGLWEISGGSLTADSILLRNDQILRLDGGTFQTTAGAIQVGQSATGAASLEVLSGSLSAAGDIDLINSSSFSMTGGSVDLNGNDFNLSSNGSNTASFSGGTFTAATLSLAAGSSVSFLAGDASVTVDELTFGLGVSTVDFASDSSGNLSIIGAGTTTFESMWDDDRLTIDGQTKSDLGGISFADSSFNTDGGTLALVPESSSFALLLSTFTLSALLRRGTRGDNAKRLTLS